MYEVLYSDEVVKEDIPKLGEPWQSKIEKAIKSKLMTRPEIYGIPLRRSLKNYRKLRVGDYRVIFRIEEKKVKVFVIKHRSVVYSVASKRL